MFIIFNKINILNILIALIPLSIILGNLAININIILIIILGFFIFGINIFITKKIQAYLIYSFFSFLIIITLINNWDLMVENELFKENIVKSIFYLRFLFLFLVVNKLIENEKFNTKIFFISSGFFSLLISIDIVIQFFLQKNIIGNIITIDKPSSFFNEENIAGGFIQRFIYFFIFYIFIKKINKNNINILILITFAIFLIPIILTANRMPFIVYACSIILYFLLEKKFKDIFYFLIFFIALILFFSKFTISNRLHYDLKSFFVDSKNIIYNAPKLFIKNELNPDIKRHDYLIHFNTGIQIWKKNKIFGNGLKSFRLKCSYNNNQTCNTHPHNYFIEILVDTGLVGIILIYSIFFIGLINFLKYYFYNKNINERFISITFFLAIFFEFLPLRSTGSFFTTGNSIFIFLILSIFLNIEKIKKL